MSLYGLHAWDNIYQYQEFLYGLDLSQPAYSSQDPEIFDIALPHPRLFSHSGISYYTKRIEE